LRPPATLPWVLHGRIEETSVSKVSRRSQNGELVECLDLDPYMVGKVAVALVFPASDATVRLFVDHAPPIDDSLNLLRRVPNVHLLRFVEPQDLHISPE